MPLMSKPPLSKYKIHLFLSFDDEYNDLFSYCENVVKHVTCNIRLVNCKKCLRLMKTDLEYAIKECE